MIEIFLIFFSKNVIPENFNYVSHTKTIAFVLVIRKLLIKIRLLIEIKKEKKLYQ